MRINHEPDITVIADAADGEEALEKFEKAEIDMVITDLNMPKIGGFKLIETLKQRKPEIPIIVFSASDDNTHITKAFHSGVSAYLTKTNSSEELIFALRHVAQGKKYLSSELSLSIFEAHHLVNYSR